MILLQNLWPIIFLASLFVCCVYLLKYILNRWNNQK